MHPRLDQRNDGLRVEPSSVIHQSLQASTGIDRPAVEGEDVTGIVSPAERQGQRFTSHAVRALVFAARSVGQERIEDRSRGRCRSTRQTHEALGDVARRAVARVVNDSRRE